MGVREGPPLTAARARPAPAGYVAGLDGFQVVLLDHRGHGQSEAPSDPRGHAVADYAGDVLALANELSLERFAFWGYSDGARVGYELAGTHPGRIAALIASGGVDGPADDPAQWHEGARAVRAGGVRAIHREIQMCVATERCDTRAR